MPLEPVKSYISAAYEWTKTHRNLVTLGLGSSIVLYGHYFPGTILVMSSLRVRALSLNFRDLNV